MIASCRRLVESKGFQRTITMVIVIAAVLVGLETSAAFMAEHGDVVHVLDQIVLAIFAAEVVLRMVAAAPRPWRYFHDPWNCFDFVIVAGAILPFVSGYVTVLRLFRLLRVLRLVRAVPRLQVLVGALLHSLPSMAYVVFLLGLLFYVYGVAGVFFFGDAAPDYFGDLGQAFFTLFQIVTLEDWVEVLASVRTQAPAALAIGYFVSFILIGTMVMLNLVIGIVLEGMKEAQANALPPRTGAPDPSTRDDVAALEADVARIAARLAQLRGRLGAPRD